MQPVIHNDFMLACPEGWVDASVFVLAGPEDSQFRPNVTVTRERLAQKMTVHEYVAAQQSPQAPNGLRIDRDVLEEESLALFDGPAIRRVQRVRLPSVPVTVQQVQVFFVRGLNAIVLTGSARADSFRALYPKFLHAIENFRFIL